MNSSDALIMNLPHLIGEAVQFTRTDPIGGPRVIVSGRAIREAGYRLRLRLNYTIPELNKAMLTIGAERVPRLIAKCVQYDITNIRSL